MSDTNAAVRERMVEALKASTADYADVRYETDDATSFTFRGPEMDRVSTGRFTGGIVRACTRGGWSYAIFDNLSDLDEKIREACAASALVGNETTQLAESEVPQDVTHVANMERDFRGVPLLDKIACAESYNNIILTADPAIESSLVTYADRFRTVHFASTRGASYTQERPRVYVQFAATARDGSLVQRSGDGKASAVDYNVVTGLEDLAAEVAGRAAALLKAPSCKGGRYTTIIDPKLAGVFAHEAFGHLSEADHLYENPKVRELMYLGRKMGVPALNIVDDGTLGRYQGTHPYDDEGTPTQKTYLIKGGVLVGHLHSLETAAKMGESPTGNARAVRRNFPPIVRMTNTYIESGDKTFEELIKDIDDGIYACHAFGGQTMMEMFTFSAGYGYRIKNGKIGELIRDVVLTGNVFETLESIDGFGNDMVIFDQIGGCGKGGQSPLPTPFGAPHLRIRNLLIGGV